LARGAGGSSSAPASRPELDHEWPRRHAEQRRSSPRHRDPDRRRRRRARLGDGSWQRDRRERALTGFRTVLHDETPGPRHGTLDRPVSGRGSRRSFVGEEQSERRRDLYVHPPADQGARRVTPQATVYVVDDDPAVLKSLTRLLRSARYKVETFAGGRD